jgi:tetrapyrrole methylase family protein/MazG family protein
MKNIQKTKSAPGKKKTRINPTPKNLHTFAGLEQVVRTLRGPTGCPWDKEQTHESLTQFAIEETFELVDAIDRGNNADICEELGDVLLQVLLHAVIAEGDGRFSLTDVIRGIATKMVERHPHVFGDVKLGTATEVLDNWASLKEAQKAKTSGSPKKQTKKDTNPFGSIPVQLPSLLRAQKIGRKTRDRKFDWENLPDVIAKVDEELAEVKAAVKSKKRKHIDEELGDLLFSVAQLARHLDMDAERSLRLANQKFEKRFCKMLEMIDLPTDKFTNLPLAKKEEFWERAKRILR